MGRYIRNIRNTFSLQPDTEESPEYYLVRVAPLSDAGNNNFFGSYSMPIGFRTGVYSFNGHRIARYLQDAVGAIESEEAVNEMANGLASALNESSTTSLIPIQGPLVIGCVVDRATGLIVGYGVGRYQPHPVVNRNGEYSGQAWHREVRGFSFDDYDDSSNIVARFITGIMLRLNNNNQ